MKNFIIPARFLFLIDNLSTGGAQRQLINLALGLKKRQYQVEIFCYAPGDILADPLRAARVPIHLHFKQGRFSLDVIFALKRLIQKQRFDLLLSFLSTPNFYAISAGRVLNGKRLPVVVSERSFDLPKAVSFIEKCVRQLYRFASYVIVNSHHQRINMDRKYPHLRNRLITIYNGYDLDKFSPPKLEPNNLDTKVLVISSVAPFKNGLCLIEALNIMRQKGYRLPKISWIGQRLMVGERGRYLRQMERRIKVLGLEPNWQWMGQRSDIVQQLHQHDVLVHPSRGEGLPNVVCEALACGRPVIVSDVLDHAKLVQNNQSGFLFNWSDPSHLAEKIITFSRLSAYDRHKMGECGRRFAEAQLSLERFIDDYERIFRSLLQR